MLIAVTLSAGFKLLRTVSPSCLAGSWRGRNDIAVAEWFQYSRVAMTL